MKIRELLEGESIKLPVKDEDLEKVSVSDIFASQIYNIIKKDLGVEFAEKPGYFSDFYDEGAADEHITESQLRKLQNILTKKNLPALKVYSSKKIYGSRGALDKDGGFSPLHGYQWIPKEGTFIIKFDNGHRYLVDTSGAKSYIRMWLRIKEGKSTSVSEKMHNIINAYTKGTEKFTLWQDGHYYYTLTGSGQDKFGKFKSVKTFDDKSLDEVENWLSGAGYKKQELKETSKINFQILYAKKDVDDDEVTVIAADDRDEAVAIFKDKFKDKFRHIISVVGTTKQPIKEGKIPTIPGWYITDEKDNIVSGPYKTDNIAKSKLKNKQDVSYFSDYQIRRYEMAEEIFLEGPVNYDMFAKRKAAENKERLAKQREQERKEKVKITKVDDKEADYEKGKLTDAELTKVEMMINDAIGNTFPDSDPMDVLYPKLKKMFGEFNVLTILDVVAKKRLKSKNWDKFLADNWDENMKSFADLHPEYKKMKNPWR